MDSICLCFWLFKSEEYIYIFKQILAGDVLQHRRQDIIWKKLNDPIMKDVLFSADNRQVFNVIFKNLKQYVSYISSYVSKHFINQFKY